MGKEYENSLGPQLKQTYTKLFEKMESQDEKDALSALYDLIMHKEKYEGLFERDFAYHTYAHKKIPILSVGGRYLDADIYMSFDSLPELRIHGYNSLIILVDRHYNHESNLHTLENDINKETQNFNNNLEKKKYFIVRIKKNDDARKEIESVLDDIKEIFYSRKVDRSSKEEREKKNIEKILLDFRVQLYSQKIRGQKNTDYDGRNYKSLEDFLGSDEGKRSFRKFYKDWIAGAKLGKDEFEAWKQKHFNKNIKLYSGEPGFEKLFEEIKKRTSK